MGFAFGILLPVAGTAIGSVRPCPQLDDWPCPAEAASGMTSASCYHVKENVRILAIVKTILKFREVQRQIFLAHVVVSAEHSTLEQRPERFDAVRMDLAANVFAVAVLNDFVQHRPFQVAIARVLIGRDQLNLVADSVADELSQWGQGLDCFDTYRPSRALISPTIASGAAETSTTIASRSSGSSRMSN
jgi:hypothetical protein